MAETIESADHHEVAHGARADGSAAQAIVEVVEGSVSGMCALRDDGLATFLAEVAHVVEADAHCVVGLNRQGSSGVEIAIGFEAVCGLGEGARLEEGGPRERGER